MFLKVASLRSATACGSKELFFFGAGGMSKLMP
jgi:hypothetical protein